MNKHAVVSASLVVALVLASCGGDGGAPSTDEVSDEVAAICRTIGRGIGDLDPAASLDDVRSNANDASALYEEAVNALERLKIPTSDGQFASDVEDLIASYEDQLDTLDDIARAARNNDQVTVDSKIDELNGLAADSNELAESLDISRCQLDPVFAAATPTTTATTPVTTPTTEPTVPLTLPIVTDPPETFPPETVPPSANKTIISSADMVPLGDYSFADAPDAAMNGFITLLDLAASVAAQSGRIAGVDVIDSTGATMGRVFAFESDVDPLTPGSFEEVTPFLTGDTPTTPRTVGTIDGLFWADAEGTANFLAGVQNVILWSFAPTEELLLQTLQAWGESISQ